MAQTKARSFVFAWIRLQLNQTMEISKFEIPGQSTRGHATISTEGALEQFWPPWAGAGLVQFRFRVKVPFPQVTLHADPVSQADQPPLTDVDKKK